MEQYIKGFKGFTPVKMCGLSPLASFYSEHDFNFKKYFTSAAVVDRKSVTMIDTELDDSVTT